MTEFTSPRDLVRRGAERHGTRIAVTGAGASLTYRELAGRTARVAEILRRAGVGPGVQVAISLPNSFEFPIWYFGVFEAGGIVIAITPTQTPTETAQILETARISFLVTSDSSPLATGLGFNLAASPGATPGTNLWRVDRDFAMLPTKPWSPDGLLVRQFSSGSTGRPKHTLRTERNTIDNLQSLCGTMGLGAGERFLAIASFGYAYGIVSLQAAFHLGGSVIVSPRFLPSQVIELARRDKPTVFLMNPPMVETLAACLIEDGDERAFDSLKICVCGTGRLRKSAYDGFLQRYGVSVRPRYGTTETMATAIDLSEGFEEGRVGRPFHGVSISILDEAGEPCPKGETGMIAIKSPAAPDHYIGDPEMSARTFRDGYVFPGDMGYLDDQGRLHVLGRSDIINIGGISVDKLEIERVIRDALPVSDVVVMEGERAGSPAIRAVIEGDPASITRASVIAVCRAELSVHKIPAHVQVFENFKRDPNGKVLKSFFDDRIFEPTSPGAPDAPDGAGS